jgi:hypothetical protein
VEGAGEVGGGGGLEADFEGVEGVADWEVGVVSLGFEKGGMVKGRGRRGQGKGVAEAYQTTWLCRRRRRRQSLCSFWWALFGVGRTMVMVMARRPGLGTAWLCWLPLGLSRAREGR